MGLIQEFKDFLHEYKVMGLAVAFIMAVATNTLIKALVDDLIMPFVGIVLPNGDWKTATLALGPLLLKWGDFLSALINFLIMAFVVFIIAKMVLKEEKVTKK
ncbi:MAG: MscL family protein [Candidatus Micrarchaeia archaeon]